MTVAAENNDNIFDGDGVTTVFSYTFPIPLASTGLDIYVYVIDNLGNISLLTSNYTLDVNAATVTYPVVSGVSPLAAGVTALPSGWQLAIYRIEDIVQSLNITAQGPFPAAGLMAALDYQTMVMQQLQEQINRCVKYPIGQAPTTTDVTTFIAAVSAAIMPAILPTTLAVLKARAALAPTVPFFGFATDLGTVGQLVFYVGSTSIGDGGFITLGGG